MHIEVIDVEERDWWYDSFTDIIFELQENDGKKTKKTIGVNNYIPQINIGAFHYLNDTWFYWEVGVNPERSVL